MSYKEFINKYVPFDKQRAVKRPCFYILLLSLIFIAATNMIIAADAGFAALLEPDMLQFTGINLLLLLAPLLLSATLEPWAAVLMTVQGALVLMMNLVSTNSYSGILPLIFGITSIGHTREMKQAYTEYIQTGKEPEFTPVVTYANSTPIRYNNINGVPEKVLDSLEFPVAALCPGCGHIGSCVLTGERLSPWKLRRNNHDSNWFLKCSECGGEFPVTGKAAKLLALENGHYPDYVRIDRPNNLKLIMAVLGIAGFIAVGFLVSVASDGSIGRTALSSDFSEESWEEGVILNIEDLMYIDCYAYEGHDLLTADVLYMLCAFDGKDGQYMCSVRVDRGDDIWDEAFDYSVDDERYMGSLIKTGGGITSLMPLEDCEYYEFAAEFYEDYFPACTFTYMELDYTGADAGAVQGSLWPFTNAVAAFFICLELVLYMDYHERTNLARAARAQRRYDSKKY